MPLINFRTDLKSLKYGNDRPGGGSSGLPYIQSLPPDELALSTDPASALFTDFYTANRDTSDFPIRGGTLNFNGPAGRPTTLASEIDAARIKAFLDDPAKGKIFVLKQQGLQLTNPNIQVPGISTVLGFDPTREILPVTRIYGPKGDSTLAQVLVQGTGQHIQRHGLFPVYTQPFEQTYEAFVTKNNTPTTNRLSILYQTKIAIDDPFSSNSSELQRQTGIGILDFSNKYGISPLGSQIFNYPGGPDSAYGIGFTIIKRATDTTQAAQKAATISNAFTLTYQQLLSQKTSGESASPSARQKIGARLQDFREQLNTDTAEPGNYLKSNYNQSLRWYNLAQKGDPGAPEQKSRINYTDINSAKIDQVNKLGPFSFAADTTTPWDASGDASNDIIKFTFECLSNDSIGDAIALVFRAYLSSFTDNHQAEYNSFRYLGRGDNFRTYQGFDRSISFGFKIAAQSREEMRPLYAKLNHLVSQTYPDYSPTSKLMRASVVQLTIGDYLYRVPGFLESVNLTLLNEAAWEIAVDPRGLDNDMNQVPQMIDVQCSFKPIHNFLPRRVTIDDRSAAYFGKPNWVPSVSVDDLGAHKKQSADAATAALTREYADDLAAAAAAAGSPDEMFMDSFEPSSVRRSNAAQQQAVSDQQTVDYLNNLINKPI
jgi:hypothetical protein